MTQAEEYAHVAEHVLAIDTWAWHLAYSCSIFVFVGLQLLPIFPSFIS